MSNKPTIDTISIELKAIDKLQPLTHEPLKCDANQAKKFAAMVKMETVNAPRRAIEPYDYGIKWWLECGSLDAYYHDIVDALTKSPTHASIIATTANMAMGEGLFSEDKEVQDWLAKHRINEDILPHIIRDYILFGGFALSVDLSLAGELGGYSFVDFNNLRAVKRLDGSYPIHYKPNWYAYSRDFRELRGGNTSDKPFNAVWFPAYNAQTLKGGWKEFVNRQGKPFYNHIFYYKNKSKNSDFYPVPDYAACLQDINVEYLFATFKNNFIANGFSAKVHIHIYGDYSEEERQSMFAAIRQSYTGAENANNIFITTGIEENATKITPINIDANADSIEAILDSSRQAIISAHQLPSTVLAGLPGNGSLGGNANEIMIAFDTYNRIRIRPIQKTIETELKRLYADYSGKNLADIDLQFKVLKPSLAMFDLNFLADYLTQNEVRELIGYEPLENEPVADEQQLITE